MAVEPRTVADYRAALLAHLPRGRIWGDDGGGPQSRLAEGCAAEAARLDLRALALLDAAFPATTAELLAEWEASLGLPDECSPNETFSRSTTATYLDASGVLRTAAPGELRFDYAPGGERLGPLIENAATNMLAWSEALDDAAWAKGGAIEVEADAARAPSRATTADRLTTSGAGGQSVWRGGIPIAAGEQYALSWFAKADTVTWCYLQFNAPGSGVRAWFDLAGAAAGRSFAFGDGVLGDCGVDVLADGWVRAWVSGVVDAASTAATAMLVPCAGDNTTAQSAGSMLAWGAQFESGGARTSYIPTGATAGAPRAADSHFVRSTQERRAAVVAKLAASGGQSVPRFVALAAAFGVGVTIEEFAPFRAGAARAGWPVAGEAWAHHWRMHAPADTAAPFRAGLGGAGEPLRSWGNSPLECVIRRAAPAHTTVSFAYDL